MPAHVTEAEMHRILAQPQVPKKRKKKVLVPVTGHPCVEPVTLIFPWGPLNNRTWRHVGGRAVLSAEARKYRKIVAELVQEQWPVGMRKPFDNRLTCFLCVSAPDTRRYDLDGTPKNILDAMQEAGVFCNDWQIDKLEIWRHRPWKP